ncbi:MAG TPA: DNA repair protein RadA [Thermodesulfovibrionales bacterium]|nr:DNA repair protein RadA [Thermodesulfovibrionales bacterium]
MSKIKTFFQCQTCGYTSPKWLGKCPDCDSWNSMAEERSAGGGRHSVRLTRSEPQLQSLSSVSGSTGKRTSTGITELDRVLGGGIVEGSVTLVGGDPGIGKSTLLLQAASQLSERSGNVLYVSGEESLQQIKLRAERLSIDSDKIILLAETNLEGIIDAAASASPGMVVIDSIQTMYTEGLTSAPGSVGQVRECAAKLVSLAKRTGISLFIIGHVTKEGAIAGPRVLEHIVDTVLYFEGDRGHSFRVLRTVKNRFGPTNEIGVFGMTDGGLVDIENPSEIFLSEKPHGASGCTVVSSIEGTRPLLIELQALVSTTTFGMPRRTCIGVDFNRVNLLVAVMEKIAGLHLGGMDIFVNVVGGIKILEPAVDLGIISSIASSLREIPVHPGTVVFGEIGLSGEIRAVSQVDARIKEAAKIGFRRAILPRTNADKIKENAGFEIIGVRDIHEFLDVVFSRAVVDG